MSVFPFKYLILCYVQGVALCGTDFVADKKEYKFALGFKKPTISRINEVLPYNKISFL